MGHPGPSQRWEQRRHLAAPPGTASGPSPTEPRVHATRTAATAVRQRPPHVCHHVRAPWLGPVSAPLSFCAGCHWRSHLLSIKGAYGNSGHHQDRCKPTRPRRQPVKEMGCEGQATKPVAMHPLTALDNQEHKVFANPDVQEPSRPTSGARAFFAMGVSCARQPPWSPPTGCQEHLPGLTPKHGSGHCQPLEGDSVPAEKLCLLRKEPMGITLNQTGL